MTTSARRRDHKQSDWNLPHRSIHLDINLIKRLQLYILSTLKKTFSKLTFFHFSFFYRLLVGAQQTGQRVHSYNEWHLDSILGTAVDVLVHVCMAFLLGQRLTTVQIMISLIIVQCSSFTILNGPWLAWSNPWSTPKWIEKRVKPLESYYASTQS